MSEWMYELFFIFLKGFCEVSFLSIFGCDNSRQHYVVPILHAVSFGSEYAGNAVFVLPLSLPLVPLSMDFFLWCVISYPICLPEVNTECLTEKSPLKRNINSPIPVCFLWWLIDWLKRLNKLLSMTLKKRFFCYIDR